MAANHGAFLRSLVRPFRAALERHISDAALVARNVVRQPLSMRALLPAKQVLVQPSSRVLTRTHAFHSGQPQQVLSTLMRQWIKASRFVRQAFGNGKNSCRRLYGAEGVGLSACLAFLPVAIVNSKSATINDDDDDDDETNIGAATSGSDALIHTLKSLNVPVKKVHVSMSSDALAELLNVPASTVLPSTCSVLPRVVVRRESPEPMPVAAPVIPPAPVESVTPATSIAPVTPAAPKRAMVHSPREGPDRIHALQTERRKLLDEKTAWRTREEEMARKEAELAEDKRVLEAQIRNLQRQLDLAMLSQQNAEAKIAELESSVNCVVCMDAPRNVLYKSCGHLVVCSDCDLQLMETSIHEHRACPMCRTAVTESVVHHFV